MEDNFRTKRVGEFIEEFLHKLDTQSLLFIERKIYNEIMSRDNQDKESILEKWQNL